MRLNETRIYWEKSTLKVNRFDILLISIYKSVVNFYLIKSFKFLNLIKSFNCRHIADGEVRFNPTDLHASNYHVVGVDLRNIDEVANKLKEADIDFGVPTIVLAECVLVYIEAANCRTLLQWLAAQFHSLVLVNYEQVNLNDRFGDVMLNNLRSRGCGLAGVEACISLDSQIAR